MRSKPFALSLCSYLVPTMLVQDLTNGSSNWKGVLGLAAAEAGKKLKYEAIWMLKAECLAETTFAP